MARNDWKRVSPKWEIGEEVRARFSTGGFRKATIVSFPSETWQSDDPGAQIKVMDSKGNTEQIGWGGIYVEKAV